MGDRPRHHTDAWATRSLSRWRALATAAAFVMMVTLAWAPTKEMLKPWRHTQARYNEIARGYGVASLPIKVRQIWIPEAQRADRCGSCHLGMVGESALEPYPPFNAHPPLPHEPEAYGCTFCHSGQGWATVAKDAHGDDGSWPHPILPSEHIEAGCGVCHSGLTLPLPEHVEDAPDLIEQYGCATCHAVEDRRGQSLTTIGLRGVPRDWVERHRGVTPPNEDIRPLAQADDDEIRTLGAWLQTQIGAPHLARGKMVFHQLGCLGCHRRGDVGGDIGPDLSTVSDKDVRDLAGEGSGSDSLPIWLRQHLIDPQALSVDSTMPGLDLEELENESDLDDLVTYLLSLRGESLPTSLSPPDHVRVVFGLGRDFPTSGQGLYVTFCAACHGYYATGAELETLGMVTPMIGTRGFLATVTPRYIRSSILRGRPGRYMPSWSPDNGGLETSEVEAIVDYLFSKSSRSRELDALTGAPDLDHGSQVFSKRCATCHSSDSSKAEGRFGRDLLSRGALRHFDRQTLYDSIMHGWAEEGMPAFAFLRANDARDLLAFLSSGRTRNEETGAGHDGLHSHFGQQIWEARCSQCHGEDGEGGSSPMLNTGTYLDWADDGYLASRIRDHAGENARAAIGVVSDDNLEALLDHLRSWSGRVEPALPATPSPDAIARGRDLYGPRCSECHGLAGRGSSGPALANRDFLETVSRDFLVMSILEGRKGTAMQPWKENKKLPVGIPEALDLADYILSLAAPGDAGSTTVSRLQGDARQGG